MVDPICLLPFVGFLFALTAGGFVMDCFPSIFRAIRRKFF